MRRRLDDHKVFHVGDVNDGADFSNDYINGLIYRIALWFQQPECDRTYDDPVKAATTKIKECLLGITEKGEKWKNAPKEFSARVRAKCAFDIDKDAGIPSRRNKNPNSGIVAERKAAKDALKNIGDVADVTGFDVEAFRQVEEAHILSAFPELDNPAHLPNVRSLTMYYAERERIDRQLTLGVSDSKRAMLLDSLKRIEDMADVTMKRLGVHPDQIRKKISDKGASSISDLAAIVSNDEDFPKRERIWALQLALQLWWMSEHANGAGVERQLHDFQIWHMTRSRPVKFTCRHGEEYTIAEGFEPHEIRDFLVKEGVLIEEPVLPNFMTPSDLAGLATADLKDGHYVEETPDDGDTGRSGVAGGSENGPERLSGSDGTDLHDGHG